MDPYLEYSGWLVAGGWWLAGYLVVLFYTRYQGRVERASGTMESVDDEMQRRVAAADAVVKALAGGACIQLHLLEMMHKYSYTC